jgi:hypothetical protein
MDWRWSSFCFAADEQSLAADPATAQPEMYRMTKWIRSTTYFGQIWIEISQIFSKNLKFE